MIGSRATYRGHRGIIIAEASYLREPRYIIRWRNGQAMTGWSQAVAPRSALSGVSERSWDVGDSVMVGYAPYRQRGTVTGTGESDGRTVFAIELEVQDRRFPDDEPAYALNLGTVTTTAGPEHIDTHDVEG